MEMEHTGRGNASRFGNIFSRFFLRQIDWVLLAGIIPLLAAGLLTMNSFVGENIFFHKQFIWILISLSAFFLLSFVDFHFLRRTRVLVFFYLAAVFILLLLFAFMMRFGGRTQLKKLFQKLKKQTAIRRQ